jgi:F-type H+-transporting ATPase subunit epsilon
MMADRIRLKIITPSGMQLDREVNYVNLPTPEGSVGILADHAPMLCAVGKGKVKYRFEGGESALSVSEGVASVENNEVNVLVGAVQSEE